VVRYGSSGPGDSSSFTLLPPTNPSSAALGTAGGVLLTKQATGDVWAALRRSPRVFSAGCSELRGLQPPKRPARRPSTTYQPPTAKLNPNCCEHDFNRGLDRVPRDPGRRIPHRHHDPAAASPIRRTDPCRFLSENLRDGLPRRPLALPPSHSSLPVTSRRRGLPRDTNGNPNGNGRGNRSGPSASRAGRRLLPHTCTSGCPRPARQDPPPTSRGRNPRSLPGAGPLEAEWRS